MEAYRTAYNQIHLNIEYSKYIVFEAYFSNFLNVLGK